MDDSFTAAGDVCNAELAVSPTTGRIFIGVLADVEQQYWIFYGERLRVDVAQQQLELADKQLQNALDRSQASDNSLASGIIYALIQSVEAQRGKKLTDEQANDIVASAEAIIVALQEQ